MSAETARKNSWPDYAMQALCSVYLGARAPRPTGQKTVSEILMEIKSEKHKGLIARGREILSTQGSDAYRGYKLSLPAVTFGGTFSHRKNENITTPTGIIIPDLDHLPNLKEVLDLLIEDEHVLFAFRSPGGDGLKVGLIADGIRSDADHKRFFKAVERYFKDGYGLTIDPACKDISRLTFLSSDPDLFINENPRLFEIREEQPESEQKHRNPHTVTKGGFTGKALYAWKAIQGCCDRIRHAPQGEMHITRRSMARVAGGYVHHGIPDDRAWGELEQAVKNSNTTDQVGALKTVRTFFEYGKRVPIDIAQDTTDRGASTTQSQARDPIPLPSELLPVAEFDFDLLPPTLAPWAEDICNRMQCPPDFVGVGIMVGHGALIGRRIGVRPLKHDNWTVTPNLWGMVVGRPGVLKSPAIEETIKPIKRLVAQALSKFEEEDEAYICASEEQRFRKAAAEENIKKLLKGNPQADISGLMPVNVLAALKPPVMKRHMSNDTSPEALGELLRQNPNGLLVHRDEIVSLLKGLDREDRVEGRGFYLTGWNGDSAYTFDRIGRGLNLHIPAVCLSILGGTQPGRLSEYIRHAVRGGTADDGLIQRFGLLVWPDTSREWNDVDRWPDSKARQLAFETYVHLDALTPESVGAQLDTTTSGVGEDPIPDGIPYLRFSPAALEHFKEWRGGLERRLRRGELHHALESHFAKYRKLIPGLSLIGHLADMGTGPISEAATLRALAWGEYLESHAQRAYGSAAQPQIAVAKAVLKRLRKGDLKTPFSTRDVWRPGWSMLTDREQVIEALNLLEDYGWIIAERKKDTGGRPSTEYTAHEGVMK